MPAAAQAGVLTPLRAIGHVASSYRPYVQRLGSAHFLSVPVGACFQLYECARLSLLYASADAGATITAVVSSRERTLCGLVDGNIAVFHRDRRIGVLRDANEGGAVTRMLAFDDADGVMHVLVAHENGDVALWEVGKNNRTGAQKLHSNSRAPMRTLDCNDAWGDDEEQARCRVVDMCLLPTHVNKVLVATARHENTTASPSMIRGASLQLFNYHTGQRLYAFAGLEAHFTAADALTCLCPSPVLDVVAVGTKQGRILLHNFVLDRTATTIESAAGDADTDIEDAGIHAQPSPVTSLAFRTLANTHASSDPTQPDILAVGGANGHINVWRLGRPCTLHATILHAHPCFASLASLRRSAAARREAAREEALAGGVAPSAKLGLQEQLSGAGVTSLHFFVGEPRLQSTGGDNAIRQYVLDPTPVNAGNSASSAFADGVPRLLRSRSGPGLPLTCVTFFDAQKILVASGDRAMRLLHVRNDSFNRELSQGRMETKANRMNGSVSPMDLKLPPAVAADVCELTALEWENVVTVHARTAGGDGDGDDKGGADLWAAAHNEAAAAYTWRTSRAAMGRHILTPTDQAQRRQLRAMTAGASAAEAAAAEAPAAGGGRKTRARVQPSALPESGWGSQAELPAVTCACISGDGHTTLVGDELGFVRAYNLQSGRSLRAYYSRPEAQASSSSAAPPARRRKGVELPLPAHVGEVAGVACDPSNRWVVSVGSVDGRLVKWTMAGGFVRTQETLPSVRVKKLAHHKLGGLLAVACEDGTVRVHESDRLQVCRRFYSSSVAEKSATQSDAMPATPARRTSKRTRRTAEVLASTSQPPPSHSFPQVTALTFSPDGRWLFCATSDSVLSVFDVPAGTVRQRSSILGDEKSVAPVVSLSVSPDGGMLATAHEGYRGVYLWSLTSPLLRSGASRGTRKDTIMLATVPTSDVTVDEDGCVVELTGDAEEEEALDDAAEAVLDAAAAGDGGMAGMVSMSRLPRQQLRMLLFGEEIRARAAPKEAPKTPDDAPFFLPSSLVPNTTGGRVGDIGSAGDLPGWGTEGDDDPAYDDNDKDDDDEDEDDNNEEEDMEKKKKSPSSKEKRLLPAGLNPDMKGIWAELAAASKSKPKSKNATGRYDRVFAYIERVGATVLDAELRDAPLGPGVAANAAAAGAVACLAPSSVDPLDADDEDVLRTFLEFVHVVIPTGECFELVQGALHVFLSEYAPLLERGSANLRSLGRSVSLDVERQWRRLESLLDEARCACEALTTKNIL